MFIRSLILLFLSVYAVFVNAQTPAAAPATNTPVESDSTLIATAKIQGFTLAATNLSRDLEQGTVLLEGNVRIIYQNQYFEADSALINMMQKKAQLKGHVKIQTTSYTIGGEEVILDYEAEQGLIYSGYVQSNNVRFQGSLIEKINEHEFFVADADYTTCSNCPATWSFQANKIRAELGGYAYLKNTTFRVGVVPALWLPYLAVPLKSDRQTGLLTPEIEKTGRGLVFAESLFWAKSRSEDMTFTFKNYSLGGPKPMIEYRYAVKKDSYGSANFAYMRDVVFASDERLNKYRPPSEKGEKLNRWALRSYNQYSLDSSTLARLQVGLVSDLQYPYEFNDEFANYAEPALDNRLSVSKQWTHSVLTADASYYRNLLAANPLEKNTAAVHRLPEVRYDSSLFRMGQSTFFLRWESSFTNFYREKAYDDMSFVGGGTSGQRFVTNSKNDPRCDHVGDSSCTMVEDGKYDEGIDQIRSGKRLTARAVLTTETFNLADFANFSPSISYNETQYFFPVGSERFNARHYVQMELNSRTKFFKIFEDTEPQPKFRYKHEIIPEIQYSVIPWIEQKQHPFFGSLAPNEDPSSSRDFAISDNALNTVDSPRGVQYDFDDRVYDRNVLSFSLLNNVIKKNLADNVYKTLMTFRVSQSYDIYQSQYGQKSAQPLSKLAAAMTLNLDQVQSSAEVYYSPYQNATNSTSTLSYLNEKQQYFKIGYTSSRIDNNQDDLSVSIGFVSPYVNVLTGVIFDVTGGQGAAPRDNRLKRTSVITQLKPPGECWAVNIFYDKEKDKDEKVKFTFDFSWDGRPPKIIPPANLKIN